MARVVESKKACTVNPLKMSQPLGASFAFLGLDACMPVMHGSQGCTSFGLVLLVRHFKEAIPLQTTAMNEVTTILGGYDNIEANLDNVPAPVDLTAAFALPTDAEHGGNHHWKFASLGLAVIPWLPSIAMALASRWRSVALWLRLRATNSWSPSAASAAFCPLTETLNAPRIRLTRSIRCGAPVTQPTRSDAKP